jgi:hypothetical protein
MSAPPAVELLAASDAMTPCGIPVPNCSGCGEAFFSWSHARIFEIEPPIAGNTPTNRPISVERISEGQ